jgi:hypothetical protein
LSSELELVNSIRKGEALVHHLEPSYFIAMGAAAAALKDPASALCDPAGGGAAEGVALVQGRVEALLREAGVRVAERAAGGAKGHGPGCQLALL